MEHLRARLPVPSWQHVLHLKLTQQKDVLPERTGEMGFPPKGVPPLELTFLPKAGSERGVQERG